MDNAETLETHSENFPSVLRTLGEPKISTVFAFFRVFYFFLQFMTGISMILTATPAAKVNVSVRKICKTHHTTMKLLCTCSPDPKEHVRYP